MNKFIIFGSGVAIGSIATWQLLKNKYEQLVQEEIDSVKKVFYRKNNPESEDQNIKDEHDNKMMRASYERTIKKEGYKDYAGYYDKSDLKDPYIIPPEEYGDNKEYEEILLTYYADDVVTDDNGEIIDDVEEIIGHTLESFGEYEEGSVHVRNDERKAYYEIIREPRTYEDMYSEDLPPHLM